MASPTTMPMLCTKSVTTSASKSARDCINDDERGGRRDRDVDLMSDDTLTTWPNARICAAAHSTDVGTISSTASRSTPCE
jgi:hypothetical protein